MTRAGAVLAVLLMVLSSFPLRAGRAGDVRTAAFKLLSQGVAAYRRGEFDLAVAKLERSAGIALNSFRAYFYLGCCVRPSQLRSRGW